MDVISTQDWRGHVHMTIDGETVYDDHNLVLTAAPELMIRALLGTDKISNIVFASAGAPIQPGARAIPGIVQVSKATGEANRDRFGRRTLATWRTVWTPVTQQTYDTLALMTANLAPFAALSVPTIILPANKSVAVRWTIYLRK